MKLHEILLPLRDNAGNRTDGHARFRAECIELVGGISVLPAIRGVWKDESRVFNDECIPYRVATDDSTWSKLVFAAHEYFPDQECIMHYIVGFEVEFSYRKGLTWKLTKEESARQEYKSTRQHEFATVSGIDCVVPETTAPSDIDTETFNYGRALGVPKDANLKLEYMFLEHHARIWGSLAQQFSKLAWLQEMALRSVRLAESAEGQRVLMKEAADLWVHADGTNEFIARSGNETVKYYRYGRAFRSGRRV